MSTAGLLGALPKSDGLTRAVLIAVGVLFAINEAVQIRKNWHDGSRAEAEIIVASTAARKNVQEALAAVAQREATSIEAVKFGTTGADALMLQRLAAHTRVARYVHLYNATLSKIEFCARTKTCTRFEVEALKDQCDLYRMLALDHDAGFKNSWMKPEVTVYPQLEHSLSRVEQVR